MPPVFSRFPRPWGLLLAGLLTVAGAQAQEGGWRERSSTCRAGSQVQFRATEVGGHSWPGGGKQRASEPPSQALSANEVMASFFTGLDATPSVPAR